MSRVRLAVWLSYLMIALCLLGMGVSIWNKAQDPMWSQMSEARRNFNILSVVIAAFALSVAYGLWRRREWGRVFGISLGAVVLFYSVGIRLLAPLIAGVEVGLDWESIVMGALATSSIVALTFVSFRGQLPANSTPHADARPTVPPDQRPSARAGERGR